MNCKHCEGSGLVFEPNGEDDFDVTYCSCEEGQRAERAGVMRHLPVHYVTAKEETVSFNLRLKI